MSVFLRSCLFAAFQLIITPPFAIIALLTFPFDPITRSRIISTWTRLILWAVEFICGIRYRIVGADNIPAQACVVLSKHQSAWETLAFQVIFPPQVYVIKRELLWIPFFGWGLAMTSPVAIDRKAGMRALKQMLAQGKDRLQHGFWIVVFPKARAPHPVSAAFIRPAAPRSRCTRARRCCPSRTMQAAAGAATRFASIRAPSP
jgi:1-acyl-sn-glycerol-3-phosphate acyltransferase